MNIEMQVPEDTDETADEQVVDDQWNTDEDIDEDDTLDNEYDEDEEYSDEDEDEDGQETGTSRGRPGIDTVLRDVAEQLSPEYAEVIRGLQRDFVQGHEVERMRSELSEALREVNSLREELLYEGDEEEPSEEDSQLQELLQNVPQEQVELLEAVLRSKGYVKQEDLSEMERERAIESANYEAVEKWGELFGTIDPDTGELNLSDEARADMAPIYDRLVNQQNLTFEDLFVLSNYEDMIEAAIEVGIEQAREEYEGDNRQRTQRARRGNVATRSAGGNTAPKLYDAQKLQDKPMKNRIEDVMRKAWRLAESS